MTNKKLDLLNKSQLHTIELLARDLVSSEPDNTYAQKLGYFHALTSPSTVLSLLQHITRLENAQ